MLAQHPIRIGQSHRCDLDLCKVRTDQTQLQSARGIHHFTQCIGADTRAADGNIRVHGIRPSDVDGAPEMHEALQFILAFVGDYPLVAHNAPFDMGVLRKSAELIEWPLPQINYTCSLAISRKTYNIESYRLNAVAYAIGHEEFNHHDALADSDACARIIIHAAKRHGAENMDELLAATKQVWKKLVTEA